MFLPHQSDLHSLMELNPFSRFKNHKRDSLKMPTPKSTSAQRVSLKEETKIPWTAEEASNGKIKEY